MNVEDIAAHFTQCQSSIFRLQRLATYLVEDEADDFNRFLAGTPFPEVDEDPWLQTIKRKVQAGVEITNLHVLPTRLTPYLRYAIDWSYIFRHLVGEQILFADAAVTRRCDPPARHDFWLFDDQLAVVMRYGPEGQYSGADRIDDIDQINRYRAMRQAIVECAFDLPELLARRRRGIYF